jgi:hypothetical protein
MLCYDAVIMKLITPIPPPKYIGNGAKKELNFDELNFESEFT